MIKTGLIGKDVSNSFSKVIHKLLNNQKYELLSLDNENDVNNLLEQDDFFFNFTIPYKKLAFAKADVLSKAAKETKVVNTLIKRSGKTYGYNTDIDGFKALISKYKINFKGKKIIIFGTGATSRTVSYVLSKKDCKSIIFLSRNPDNKTSFSYKNVNKYKGANIIINTTPIGKSIKDKSLIDFSKLSSLETYIDVNYNLMHNSMALKAMKIGARAINGLTMLVEQAIKSEELYQNIEFEKDIKESVYLKTLLKFNNIALIGHPFAGKTTIGKQLAKQIGGKFLDTDTLVEAKENLTINSIFANFGEEYFREKESAVINQVFSKVGQVVSLGGGSVTKKDNMNLVLPNSIVVTIDRDITKIKFDSFKNRPLVRNQNDFLAILFKRRKLYKQYADIEINNNKKIDDAVNALRGALWNSLL